MISQKHLEFIRLVSKNVLQRDAWRQASGNLTASDKTAAEKGSKWAKRFAKEIQAAREAASKAIEIAYQNKEVQDALVNIPSEAQADAKAFRILTENDLVDDSYVIGFNKETKKLTVAPFQRKPTQAEIQKAYDLFCKRFGKNSPAKLQTEHTFIEQPLFPDTISPTETKE